MIDHHFDSQGPVKVPRPVALLMVVLGASITAVVGAIVMNWLILILV
ncbi:MAG TPA: hypothetical protein VFS66_00655 [Acidimicrobiia bacterium]|nr:hypothetical protein [Acidimicrobiia bacterium]